MTKHNFCLVVVQNSQVLSKTSRVRWKIRKPLSVNAYVLVFLILEIKNYWQKFIIFKS